MLKRASYLVYGVAVYVMCLLTFVYTIGFVGNLWPSLGLAGGIFRGMDIGGKPASIGEACLIDLSLVLLFAVQHSVMARTSFKSWWARVVPTPVERSTFVLATSLCLLLLFWQWRPIGVTKVWDLSEGAMRTVVVGLSILGWIIVLSSTFMIDHFDLFGLRQVCSAFRDRTEPEVEFSTPALYRVVRHPIYSGFMIAFWSTPTMTIGHLVFAAATSGYVLVAVRFEERDLVRRYGDAYRAYRRRTGMLAPFPRRHGGASENVSSM